MIAILADRELSGGVKNTRLAVRKQRDGVSGFEIPFTARMAETGTDDDGDPVTAPVIDWQAPQQTAQADARWTPSMQVLRRVLMSALVDCGQKSGHSWMGRRYAPATSSWCGASFTDNTRPTGTDQQKADARRKAFSRSVKNSIARGVVASREVDGVQLIWLAMVEGGHG